MTAQNGPADMRFSSYEESNNMRGPAPGVGNLLNEQPIPEPPTVLSGEVPIVSTHQHSHGHSHSHQPVYSQQDFRQDDQPDPNATRLSVEHFRPSGKYASSASSPSPSDGGDSNVPFYKTKWFIGLSAGVALLIIIIAVIWYQKSSQSLDQPVNNFASGAALNDLEFL